METRDRFGAYALVLGVLILALGAYMLASEWLSTVGAAGAALVVLAVALVLVGAALATEPAEGS